MWNSERVDELLRIIEDDCNGNINVAASKIFNTPKHDDDSLYLISLGLARLVSKKRANRRREFKRELQPKFNIRGKKTLHYNFSAATKAKLLQQTQDLFGVDGWNIGKLNIGDATKEDLLKFAEKEARSAYGNLVNEKIYRALAEPLQSGQTARSHWTKEAIAEMKRRIEEEIKGKRPDLT
jgi:hypothetical protein